MNWQFREEMVGSANETDHSLIRDHGLVRCSIFRFMAPADSGVKSKAWELPVSAVMLPFDGIIRTATLWDEAKAKKGDANAALSLAKQQLDWGAGRRYFEYQSQQWHAKAKELKHPQAQGPYEQWREEYTPPPPSNSLDWLTPQLPLFIN